MSKDAALKLLRRYWVLMVVAVLSGCGSQSTHSRAKPEEGTHDVLKAIREYNDFIERTVAQLESIPDEAGRRKYVSGLRVTLENETERFRCQLAGAAKREKTRKIPPLPAYRDELTRLQRNSARATELLKKYALP